MTSAQAAAVLGITVPRFSGKTQADVETQLAAWKEGPLKKAWRVAAMAFHPDRNPDDAGAEARFKEASEAHDFLQGLQVRLRVPVKSCPQEHVRIPPSAKFCHECGYAFDADPLVESLRRAGILERNIVHIRESGELEKIRGDGPSKLQEHIRLLQQRQRLGLFGQHAGWPR